MQIKDFCYRNIKTDYAKKHPEVLLETILPNEENIKKVLNKINGDI